MGWGALIGGLAAGAGTYLAAKESGGGPETERDSRYTGSQQRLLNKLTNKIRREIDDEGDVYPGSVVPEATPGMERAQELGQTMLGQQIPGLATQAEENLGREGPERMRDLGSDADQLIEQGRGMLEGEPPEGTGTLRSRGKEFVTGEEWDPERSRERWRETVYQPAMETYQEEMAPQVMEKFGARNALSSSGLNAALAESSGNVQEETMRKLADMTYQDYARHRQEQTQRAGLGQSLLESALRGEQSQRQLGASLQQQGFQQATGALGQAEQLEMSRQQLGGSQLAQALQQAGAAPDLGGLRELERQEALEEKQKWTRRQPVNNPWLAQYAGTALGTQPMQTTYYNEPPSAMSQALTTFGSSMMSSGMQNMGGYNPSYGSGATAAGQGMTVRPNYYQGGTAAPYGVGTNY